MSKPNMTWEEAVQWLREQPDKQHLVRACFFDDPLLDAAKRFHAGPEWTAVREFLPNIKGTALDVGAGRGIASFALAEDGWEVTALEPDPSDLVGAGAIAKLARISGHRIMITHEWGERLPYADASFMVVHARQVLHHAQDLGQFCREIARVLKPGGIFIATREHVIDLPEELEIFRTNHELHQLYGGESAFTLEQYLNAISRAGLYLHKVLTPSQSPINYFPATKQEILCRAQEAWMWGFPLSSEDMLEQLDYAQPFPGRLYTFVAQRPASIVQDSDKSTTEALLARIVMLEARLHAREIEIGKRCAAANQKLCTSIRKKITVTQERISIIEKKMTIVENNFFFRCFRRLYNILSYFKNYINNIFKNQNRI